MAIIKPMRTPTELLHKKCQQRASCKGPGCRAHTGKTEHVRKTRTPGVSTNNKGH